MKVTDLDPELLCNRHLLTEHASIHAIWKRLVQYPHLYPIHPSLISGDAPEISRWYNHEAALYVRHGQVMEEMLRRKLKHNSRLTGELKDMGTMDMPAPLTPIIGQKQRLVRKCEGCRSRIFDVTLDTLF